MKNKYIAPVLLGAGIAFVLYSCGSTIPKKAVAVINFDKAKYLGKWFEIARLDYKWERNLDNVTAEYSLNDNGTIRVDNKGYDVKKDRWEQSIGKARFVKKDNVGMLKVSFFGPFYSGYNIIAVDSDYKYALVAGESLKYMWILSRETTMPESIKADFLIKAQEIGYNISDLVWVKHDKTN
ncbi:apolipoprotein D and lipocalin family protein [Flavobacterium sp. CF108]|jgi:apolipoprotein D and lipocalin family protein|uniref:lipocalin family protein n=1 Tax=unclassified Flavobacterium TaxID=196869 RepID=UPI0008D052DB|nr:MULTISPECIES: lipocalin family protein [unclassified Flavobacterium]SEO93043.1 apolipoprotein D and lipocalin family protein [Flavobacterium sp. fv08]SHH83876.1 apolipoprotein D and lipocalin family protein [Flavobacterium sp. CF108]